MNQTVASSALNLAAAPPIAARTVRPTVALYIPTLGMGGAERQAVQLANSLDPAKWRVLLLTTRDEEWDTSAAPGVVYRSLRGRKGIAAVRMLSAILARERVDIVQAFLLSAQAYALAARLLRREMKLIAAVRASMGRDRIVGWRGKLSHTLLFHLPLLVDQYVFNSSAGERALGNGLAVARKRVIFNGIDTARFRPASLGSGHLRDIARVAGKARIVGIIANVNVDKGYEALVRAAAIVCETISDVCFVVIGDDRNRLADQIKAMIAERSLTPHFRFLGSRDDIERLVPGMDIVCSSSTSEGFSNAIGEAMACGVPCVVTDVGDSALMVGETGSVVPPDHPAELAAAMVHLLRHSREALQALGTAARARIESHFSVRRMVESYEALYESLLQKTQALSS